MFGNDDSGKLLALKEINELDINSKSLLAFMTESQRIGLVTTGRPGVLLLLFMTCDLVFINKMPIMTSW